MLRTSRFIYKNFSESFKGGIKKHSTSDKEDKVKESTRLQEFRKKLQEKPPLGATIPKTAKVEEVPDSKKLRAKAPLEKLEELEEGQHPYQEKEPLKPFPDNINPDTGESNGPKGPEPTRYGDWERKGRVTDF